MAPDRDDVALAELAIGGTIVAVGIAVVVRFCTSQTGREWRDQLRVWTLGGVTTLERTLRDQCAMCQENMEAGGVVRRLSCDHVFHKRCTFSIDKWLRENRVSCPICRKTAYPVLPWKAPPPPSSPPTSSPSSAAVRSEEQDLEGQNELPPPPPQPILAQNPEEQNQPLLPPPAPPTVTQNPPPSSSAHASGLELPLLQP